MKRFVLVLALVAVAGATYVATAPGSQTAGPTAKQFRALKKEVAGLKKQLGQVKGLALSEAGLLLDCMAVARPIDQFGDGTNHTYGYSYVNGGPPTLTTALNYAPVDDGTAIWFTGGTAQCGTDLNAPGAPRKLTRLAATLRGFSTERH